MSKLKPKKIKSKPHPVYKTNIEVDYQIDDLAAFLKGDLGKRVDIIINGKKISFSSAASRKKFAEGFYESGRIIFKHTKKFAEETQGSINRLTNELEAYKKEVARLRSRVSDLVERDIVHDAVSRIRNDAWDESEREWEETCGILKNRLEKVEPVIKLLKKTDSEAALHKAALEIKKRGL